MEAMRLYIRTLEEEVPNWWTPEVASAFESEAIAAAEEETEAPAAANGLPSTTTTTAAAAPTTVPAPPAALHNSHSSVNAVSTVKSRSVAEVVVEGSWVSPYIASHRRPPPPLRTIHGLSGRSAIHHRWQLRWKVFGRHVDTES